MQLVQEPRRRRHLGVPGDRSLADRRRPVVAGDAVRARSGRLLLALDPLSPETIYAAASELGVYRSPDAGAAWQPLLAGLPPLDGPPFNAELYDQLVADPLRSGTLYLATGINGVLSFAAQ